jgi:hypothetical protein
MNEITFNNEFDLTKEKLSNVVIRENYNKDNCFIWNVDDSAIAYNSFVLTKNRRSKTICEISFFKSSITNKYIPRLTFKRLFLNNEEQDSNNPLKVNISFNHSDSAQTFWQLISFLNSYKDLVDTGEFESRFKVVSKESYILEFKDKNEKQKIEDLKELINIADLSTTNIKALTFESRKQNLKAFYYLLINKEISAIKDSHSIYREKYKIRNGEEYIWHHFLKKHDWILGLNVDLKFIIEFLDEQKVGQSDSKGKKDPQIDLLGISEFTTLVELKHSNTSIFKKEKSKGRANTWDFTSDFIEGVSQCLGQKFELDKAFEGKIFVREDKTRLDKNGIQSIDPQSVLIIGNKKKEFPIYKSDDINLVKNKTLERFRRNNRNIDVLTYDELFERAYHIVYSKKLSKDWYWENEDEIFKE